MSVSSIAHRFEENTKEQLRKEQQGLQALRGELVEEFLMDPQAFVRSHGKRPEDLSGTYLRSLQR